MEVGIQIPHFPWSMQNFSFFQYFMKLAWNLQSLGEVQGILLKTADNPCFAESVQNTSELALFSGPTCV